MFLLLLRRPPEALGNKDGSLAYQSGGTENIHPNLHSHIQTIIPTDIPDSIGSTHSGLDDHIRTSLPHLSPPCLPNHHAEANTASQASAHSSFDAGQPPQLHHTQPGPADLASTHHAYAHSAAPGGDRMLSDPRTYQPQYATTAHEDDGLHAADQEVSFVGAAREPDFDRNWSYDDYARNRSLKDGWGVAPADGVGHAGHAPSDFSTRRAYSVPNLLPDGFTHDNRQETASVPLPINSTPAPDLHRPIANHVRTGAAQFLFDDIAQYDGSPFATVGETVEGDEARRESGTTRDAALAANFFENFGQVKEEPHTPSAPPHTSTSGMSGGAVHQQQRRRPTQQVAARDYVKSEPPSGGDYLHPSMATARPNQKAGSRYKKGGAFRTPHKSKTRVSPTLRPGSAKHAGSSKSPARRFAQSCSPSQRRPYSPVTPRSGTPSTPTAESSKALTGKKATPKTSKSPGNRVDKVEDTDDGIANLRQLHMYRAHSQNGRDRRPLLHANLRQAVDPMYRILTSNKFYKGRFFEESGKCCSKRCILINFPRVSPAVYFYVRPGCGGVGVAWGGGRGSINVG